LLRSRLKARLLTQRDRDAALGYLKREAHHNLLLIEMAASVGHAPTPSEQPPRVVAAWRGGEVVGVASLRPSVVVDYAMSSEVLDVCLPYVASVETGLIKSAESVVTPLWERLRRRGRYALIDRGETAYRLCASQWDASPQPPAHGIVMRPAVEADLDDLVFAARASLREEDRPDPFDGDPAGFRRWVQGRLHRARLVEYEGRVVFVGYADVRRPEGWLIQGVYTWPADRRRGFADVGMRGMVREAMESGADHVQLAVVEGNDPAIGLYAGLGFEPFSLLRTILFL
jgi:predicted GNAT family acetyltransferase